MWPIVADVAHSAVCVLSVCLLSIPVSSTETAESIIVIRRVGADSVVQVTMYFTQ